MLKYRFSYRVKLSLLVALLLPVLLKLGFWQLSRYQEKLDLELSLKERLEMPVMSLFEANRYADPMYLPVKVRGRFVSDQYFLHDNQIHNGQAGYDLLMPFVTESGRWLLINRGWLVSGFRDVLPDITTSSGPLEIKGSLYRLLGDSFTLGQDYWGEDWPKRIQSIDFNRVSDALNKSVPMFIFKLDADQAGALQYRPQEFRTSSQKHLGYAVQWFLMSLVLLALYLWQMKNHASSTSFNNTTNREEHP
ncbi:hypothetical protein EOPP23_10125 [Endozoicomonas sp. OPT23]|uniref:SURF1 family protein n=1 Tax=Endozoicomonas sp. OPT23 TaxID=2072845 RepID=UPI00129A3AB5|nr:SURF1 family protein [Endozoicomonas sp. OPT23]MRI33340.1 hypothetical protein [Endozoicomonas sp. OPT23]